MPGIGNTGSLKTGADVFSFDAEGKTRTEGATRDGSERDVPNEPSALDVRRPEVEAGRLGGVGAGVEATGTCGI